MSRSRKKNPYCSTACYHRNEMRRHKQSIRQIERKTEEIPNGSAYKKFNERWCFPDDGRHLWIHPKGYRK